MWHKSIWFFAHYIYSGGWYGTGFHLHMIFSYISSSRLRQTNQNSSKSSEIWKSKTWEIHFSAAHCIPQGSGQVPATCSPFLINQHPLDKSMFEAQINDLDSVAASVCRDYFTTLGSCFANNIQNIHGFQNGHSSVLFWRPGFSVSHKYASKE